ncbi:MAG TPA: hypothetical protein VIM71_00530 [Lacunisphaera sp.]
MITLLTAICLAEAGFIVGLVGGRTADHEGTETLGAAGKKSRADSSMSAPSSIGSTGQSPAGATGHLAQQKHELETKLAEVTKELNERKSEISFSYGTIAQSGRFVGMTFRKMFETAAARDASEEQIRMADNQINVLSLGPFIQDAEVFEADPVAFAQFQAPLISEVLGIPPDKSAELEITLSDLKSRSLKVEEGSTEWFALNDAALQKVTSLLTPEQRQAMKRRIGFFEQYGVLMIPAYSILRAPTPTVVQP